MKEHVEALFHVEMLQDRFDDVQVAIVAHQVAIGPPFLGLPEIQGLDRYLAVVARRDGAISILVNGRAEDYAAPLVTVGRDVRPAAGEANPQRRLAPNQHLLGHNLLGIHFGVFPLALLCHFRSFSPLPTKYEIQYK